VSRVAVLYVETGGVYFGLDGVDPWDITRDAKKYDGPWPVVAHPPCGPWGSFRFMCTKQDPSCGPRAIEQVRAFGGVLEHPAGSTLFRGWNMPMPGEFGDVWGGVTYEVDQLAWGHPCRKRTWLYVVGVPRSVVVEGFRFGGVATHRITTGPGRGRYDGGGAALREAHAKMRSRTPIAFRDWLLSLARAVERKAGAV
jgi:hypothetical protein